MLKINLKKEIEEMKRRRKKGRLTDGRRARNWSFVSRVDNSKIKKNEKLYLNMQTTERESFSVSRKIFNI